MDRHQSRGSLRTLGRKLKEMRSQANETLAEASGAVEIDVRELASFELGQSRPNEEVLLLLISHFGAKDDEALKLWELAGYAMDRIPVAHLGNSEQASSSVAPTLEKHILFTDVVDVVVNKYGVVMNFMQNNGPNNKPAPVARIGMSREHASSVLQILQITLSQTEQNSLKFPDRIITSDNPAQEDQPRN